MENVTAAKTVFYSDWVSFAAVLQPKIYVVPMADCVLKLCNHGLQHTVSRQLSLLLEINTGRVIGVC
jgi:hypothetical protein